MEILSPATVNTWRRFYVDEARVLAKLDELHQYLAELKETLPRTLEEYMENRVVRRAVERLIHISIECLLDICALLVKELRLGLPQDEEDYISKLEGVVFPSSFTASLKRMKSFRNIVVHRYGRIDDEKVFLNITENLGDFRTFMDYVRRALSKIGGEKEAQEKRPGG